MNSNLKQLKNREDSVFSNLLSPKNIMILCVIMLITGVFISFFISKVGFAMEQQFSFKLFWDCIFNYDYENVQHYIFRDVQLPRVIGAILVGCYLAVGGSVMQSVTRNYLADPSIVGVNAGATLGLTLGFVIMRADSSYFENVAFSIAGALISTLFIFFITPMLKGSDSKLKLLLVGSAISMLISSISSTISLKAKIEQELRLWSGSGLTGVKWMGIAVLSIGLLGVIIAFVFAKEFTVLSMGDEMAIALGQRVNLVKTMGIIAVAVMSGVVVSVVGSIGFIGFMIPNISKMICGDDYRKTMPLAAMMGTVFFLYTDILSRTINYPYETPISSITSVIAIPFFLFLVNSKKVRMIDGSK